MRGLTSLFGMGRGEHPWKNHHKNIQIPETKYQRPNRWVDIEFRVGILIRSYWEMLEDSSNKPFLEND